MSDEGPANRKVPDRPWITVAEALSLRAFRRAWGADVLKEAALRLWRRVEDASRSCLAEAAQNPRCAPFARHVSEVKNSHWNGRGGRPRDDEAVKAALDNTPSAHWPASAQVFLSHLDADREHRLRLFKASAELWQEAYAERVQLRGQRCSTEPARLSRDWFREVRQPLLQVGEVEFITSHYFRTPPVYSRLRDQVVPGHKHPPGAPAFYGVEVAREGVVQWLDATSKGDGEGQHIELESNSGSDKTVNARPGRREGDVQYKDDAQIIEEAAAIRRDTPGPFSEELVGAAAEAIGKPFKGEHELLNATRRIRPKFRKAHPGLCPERKRRN